MTRRIILSVGLALVAVASLAAQGRVQAERVFAPMPAPDEPITRITFGSCFDPTRAGASIWDRVLESEPDVFLFAGDCVYADTDHPDRFREAFEALDDVSGYVALRASVPMIAVWDDHDYGFNDSGADFAHARRQNQALFLDAFNEPPDSPRRAPRMGIYDCRVFGPEGARLQVIVLDTRFNRSDLERDPDQRRADWVEGRPGYYRPVLDASTTVLGEEQWEWLEDRLREPAEARLILTSVQFVADDHRFEKWGNFPHERRRLIDLIKSTGAEGVFFLSGDRHRAELSREDDAPYPLYDLTSSGMNRSGGNYRNEINTRRVGSLFAENNFGVVQFTWGEQAEVRFELHDAEGTVRLRHRVPLDHLRPE